MKIILMSSIVMTRFKVITTQYFNDSYLNYFFELLRIITFEALEWEQSGKSEVYH